MAGRRGVKARKHSLRLPLQRGRQDCPISRGSRSKGRGFLRRTDNTWMNHSSKQEFSQSSSSAKDKRRALRRTPEKRRTLDRSGGHLDTRKTFAGRESSGLLRERLRLDQPGKGRAERARTPGGRARAETHRQHEERAFDHVGRARCWSSVVESSFDWIPGDCRLRCFVGARSRCCGREARLMIHDRV